MTPQAAVFTGVFTNQTQPLPSPIRSTTPKPPKTTTTSPGGSPAKHSATLLMLAPKSHRPIIRDGTSFDMINHTHLLSVWQFRTNPAPSGAVFAVRFSADEWVPTRLGADTYTTWSPGKALYTRSTKPCEWWNTTPAMSNPKLYSTKNNNTRKRDPQSPGPSRLRSQRRNIHACGLEFAAEDKAEDVCRLWHLGTRDIE
ncbi:hypothetical protein JB92DRAFT_3143978 [Gautieria morchelliformis]|nr:hypothetical protein JB92DRAFT_3143978 [Gautieria morchelliformis]